MTTTPFTHNLKVLIFDKNNDVVEDENLLREIKEKLQNKRTYIIKTLHVAMKWEIKKLNKIQTHFMGDLFTSASYEADSIIYEHMENTLKDIEKELNIINKKIRFHITRMPVDKIRYF